MGNFAGFFKFATKMTSKEPKPNFEMIIRKQKLKIENRSYSPRFNFFMTISNFLLRKVRQQFFQVREVDKENYQDGDYLTLIDNHPTIDEIHFRSPHYIQKQIY